MVNGNKLVYEFVCVGWLRVLKRRVVGDLLPSNGRLGFELKLPTETT